MPVTNSVAMIEGPLLPADLFLVKDINLKLISFKSLLMGLIWKLIGTALFVLFNLEISTNCSLLIKLLEHLRVIRCVGLELSLDG